MRNSAGKGNERGLEGGRPIGRRLRAGLVATLAVVAAGQSAVQGQTIFKADNNLAATDTLSWDGGVVPAGNTAAIAVWDNRVTGPTTIDTAGWSLQRSSSDGEKLRIVDPGGLVTLSGASAINVGRARFNLSNATQDLRMDVPLTQTGGATQFTVPSGRKVELLKSVTFGGGASRQLQLYGIQASGTGGSVDISGAINGSNMDLLLRYGITTTLSGNNTFTSANAIGINVSDASRLFVNNTAGSGTGVKPVSVASGATLGGFGFIGSATTVAGYLAPGAETGVGSVGTLTFNNNLTISGIRAGGLKFELAGPSASDKVVVGNGGLLDIGTLTWDRFDFTPLAGFGPGTYTLFDTAGGSITGTIDENNKAGQIAGYNAYLQTGSLQLVVVPEPGGIALGVAGAVAAGAAGLARRRRA